MRRDGCRNPHKCGVGTRKLLNSIKDEWNPLSIEHNEEHHPINEGILEKIRGGESVLFTKDIRNGTTLSE